MIKKINKKFKKEIGWLLEEKYPTLHRDFLCGRELNLSAEVEQDIRRLKAGEPLAYVIGFVDFLGCRIDLAYRPLIPRPETEYWVEAVIKNEKIRDNKVIKCLDIFAGSGCIGLAILTRLKNARVDFADVDKNFLKQIKINAELNKITKSRCQVIQSDGFKKIKGRYDYILANPPYIPAGRRARVQKSVLNFEPPRALWGGEDGLFFIKQFLQVVRDHLKKDGRIFLEFSPEQKTPIAKLFKKFNYQKWQFFRDQYGRWRWAEIIARRPYSH